MTTMCVWLLWRKWVKSFLRKCPLGSRVETRLSYVSWTPRPRATCWQHPTTADSAAQVWGRARQHLQCTMALWGDPWGDGGHRVYNWQEELTWLDTTLFCHSIPASVWAYYHTKPSLFALRRLHRICPRRFCWGIVRKWVNSRLKRRHWSWRSPSPIGSGARYFSIHV